MRNFDPKNQIWFVKDGEVTKIGFTKSFLDSLDQCWQVLPANMVSFKEKAPLLTVETNDGLISIPSPVTGSLLRYEHTARDFPDHLLEDTVIMEIGALRPRQQAQERELDLRPTPPPPLRPRGQSVFADNPFETTTVTGTSGWASFSGIGTMPPAPGESPAQRRARERDAERELIRQRQEEIRERIARGESLTQTTTATIRGRGF